MTTHLVDAETDQQPIYLPNEADLEEWLNEQVDEPMTDAELDEMYAYYETH